MYIGDIMENYIREYEEVLDRSICKQLIEKFEINKDQQVNTNLKGHRNFTEINLNQHDDWKNIVADLYQHLTPYVKRYAKYVGIGPTQWPTHFGWEQMRFKKYEPNDLDEFKEHVDVGNYETARRFLVFFLYLNDNEEGWTSFSNYDMKVQPKTGKLLMFPPTWTYLHAGHKPIKTPKYILGSYLHYT